MFKSIGNNNDEVNRFQQLKLMKEKNNKSNNNSTSNNNNKLNNKLNNDNTRNSINLLNSEQNYGSLLMNYSNSSNHRIVDMETSLEQFISLQNKGTTTSLQQLRDEDDNFVKIVALGCGDSGKTIFTTIVRENWNSIGDVKMELLYKELIQMEMLKYLHELLSHITLQNFTKNSKLNLTTSGDYKYYHFLQHFLQQTNFTQPINLIQNNEDYFTRFVKDISENFDINIFTKIAFGKTFDTCLSYFLNEKNRKRILSCDYNVTMDDLIRIHRKTTGIVENIFLYKNYNVKLFDTGGQRNERKKWFTICNEKKPVECMKHEFFKDCKTLDDCKDLLVEKYLKNCKDLINDYFFVNSLEIDTVKELANKLMSQI
ncbi:hypothetical protein ABK040_014487 [Willaertia magna]